MKRWLRLPEAELPGVIHGYSLAESAFLHGLDRFFRIPERILFSARLERVLIDRPIFIVGPYRSGTTLLQEILAAHPRVGHFWFLTNVFGQAPILSYYTVQAFYRLGLLDRAPIAPVHNPTLPATILSPFECESIWLPTGHSLWDEACRDMRLDADFNHPGFEDHLRRLIRGHLYVSRASRFLNKNPLNSLRIAYLHKLFPEAIFINLVRDPLETVISHYRTALRVEQAFALDADTTRIFREHLFIDMLSRRMRTENGMLVEKLNEEHPLLGIAGQWVGMQAAVQAAASGIPDLSLLTVRYEDLVQDPNRTLHEIWERTGLGGEEAERITALYRNRISPRPPVELSDKEEDLLPRIKEIVALAAEDMGYHRLTRPDC